MSAFCVGPRWRLSIKHSTPCIFGSLKPEQFSPHIGQKHLKMQGKFFKSKNKKKRFKDFRILRETTMQIDWNWFKAADTWK